MASAQFATLLLFTLLLAGCATSVTSNEEPREPIAVVTAPPGNVSEADEAEAPPPATPKKPAKSKTR